MSEQDQLYHELHSVIHRYTDEADLSYFMIIGALEAVKQDVHETRVKQEDAE